MLSLSSISSNQADRYFFGRDNYYTRDSGEWQGRGAACLGLTGDVERADFRALLDGRHPLSGDQLIKAGVNGEHRAGLDLTFSAPKSVSIAAEIVCDLRVRVAHENAVSRTLGYIETNFAQARITEGKKTETIDTGSLVFAKITHNFSREIDPQLHTHTVVFNMTQRPDGRWRAISNESIYENKMLIGQVYRNELAASLQHLGYSIRSDSKGLFEIEGINSSLIDHFSRRREQIDRRVEEIRHLYPKASEQKIREYATLGSRHAKSEISMNEVRETWKARIRNEGYSIEGIRHECRSRGELNHSQCHSEREYLQIAANAITDQKAVFSRSDILRTAGILSCGSHRISDLDGAFNEMVRDENFVHLETGFTTRDMQSIEKNILSAVELGRGQLKPMVTKERADRAISKYEKSKEIGLTKGQRLAVSHVLSSPDQIIGINGAAGTGKTTMLDFARSYLEEQGYAIRGLAFTGQAAAEITKNSGIESQTLHSFLSDKEAISGRGEVWVVDEASMVGSRQMDSLLSRAEQSGARVVLLGDRDQLQAIEAGKPFRILQEKGVLNTVHMNDIIRQADDQYRDVVTDLHSKRIDSAFDKITRAGRMHEIEDRSARLSTIVNEFTRNDHQSTLIITARNRDRNELNSAIRDNLKSSDRIGQTDHVFTVRESKNFSPTDRLFSQSYNPGDIVYAQRPGIIGRAGSEAEVVDIDRRNQTISVSNAKGESFTIDLKTNGNSIAAYSPREKGFTQDDQIVFLKNDRRLGVQNGLTGRIQSLDGKENIHVSLDNGRDLHFNLKEYRYIDHGYAVTDYKSQGRTSLHVLYHADTNKEVNYNQAYVALSRGKHSYSVYTNNASAFREQIHNEIQKTSTLGHDHPNGRDPKIEAGSNEKAEFNHPSNDEKEGSDYEAIYRQEWPRIEPPIEQDLER